MLKKLIICLVIFALIGAIFTAGVTSVVLSLAAFSLLVYYSANNKV